jgi:hypothetical protein
MIYNLTLIEITATLCQVMAGDSHQYGSTVQEVQASQRECHAFYAKCLQTKNIDICMIEREQLAQDKIKDSLKGIKK